MTTENNNKAANLHDANLYTIQEFGRRNKSSKSTIYEKINDGKIEITKVGRKTYISAAQEKAYLESLRRHD